MHSTGKKHGHAHLTSSEKWLVLIGAGKLIKGLLFASVALSLLRLVHIGFGNEMAVIANYLSYADGAHFLVKLFDKASLLSDRRIEQVAMIAGLFATADIIEAIGLLMRKVWAEWFTTILTCALLPFDIFVLLHRFTWLKLAFTLLNALIAAYLIWDIRRRHAGRGALEPATA
jgi:uncharacterized membrane protein (DUF2068 family)